MGHHILAQEPARIGQALGVLVGRGVEHDARVLRRPGGQHHDARLLHLLLVLGIEVFDAGHLAAVGLVRTRVTVACARTSAPAFLASPDR